MENRGVDWRTATLFLITLAIIGVCALMLRPFLAAITGAVGLAIATNRPYRWIERRLKRPTFAATVSLIAVIVSIVVPATILVHSIAKNGLAVARAMQHRGAEVDVQAFLQRSPRAAALEYAMDNLNLEDAPQKVTTFIGAKLAKALGGSVAALAQIFIMLFLLFFLYRDGQQAISWLRRSLPLTESESDFVLNRLHETIGDCVRKNRRRRHGGWWLGSHTLCSECREPRCLGSSLLALVPGFGAFLVWAPVVVYLAQIHAWGRAIVMAAAGGLVISTLDNFLYPVLVGSRIRLHTPPVFFALFGGVWLMGIPGLVLGPMAFTLVESLFAIWRQRTGVDAPEMLGARR